jgi:transcriptional regulator with XRE-family HTH domain
MASTLFAPDLERFGLFIKDARSQRHLTQQQLAERCGWSQERVSVLEHGRYGTPSLTTLAILASSLELTRADVLVPIGYLD